MATTRSDFMKFHAREGNQANLNGVESVDNIARGQRRRRERHQPIDWPLVSSPVRTMYLIIDLGLSSSAGSG